MLSETDNTQTDVIDVFNSIARCPDDLLNTDNPYWENKCYLLYN